MNKTLRWLCPCPCPCPCPCTALASARAVPHTHLVFEPALAARRLVHPTLSSSSSPASWPACTEGPGAASKRTPARSARPLPASASLFCPVRASFSLLTLPAKRSPIGAPVGSFAGAKLPNTSQPPPLSKPPPSPTARRQATLFVHHLRKRRGCVQRRRNSPPSPRPKLTTSRQKILHGHHLRPRPPNAHDTRRLYDCSRPVRLRAQPGYLLAAILCPSPARPQLHACSLVFA